MCLRVKLEMISNFNTADLFAVESKLGSENRAALLGGACCCFI